MIEASNITARIGAVRVLHRVSLKATSGQILAVLGANGAGKTSLLRVLSNLSPVESGEIVFDGSSTRAWDAHELARRGLVHVPQGRQIIPTLSVLDNLRVGALAMALPESELNQQIENEFKRFPVLRDRQALLGGALSGGEQQMLAVSRALVMRPKVLMLDEPSLGLAPRIVRLILATLRELADAGMAIILVEQAAMLALEVADQAIVLRNGECAMAGAAATLRDDSAMVASYLS